LERDHEARRSSGKSGTSGDAPGNISRSDSIESEIKFIKLAIAF
jgi:hypothetical protein